MIPKEASEMITEVNSLVGAYGEGGTINSILNEMRAEKVSQAWWFKKLGKTQALSLLSLLRASK